MKICAGFVLTIYLLSVPLHPSELFEDFDWPGKPEASNGVDWRYTDQMLPVKNWEEIIPGDGFAYLKIDAVRSNDRDKDTQKWPFQMISLSPVEPGHRLEMKAKNTVISDIGSFIFTYQEADGIFDEFDIEIVGDDAATLPENHPTDLTGWTDARFNAWANSGLGDGLILDFGGGWSARSLKIHPSWTNQLVLGRIKGFFASHRRREQGVAEQDFPRLVPHVA
jgi:hypothetical protein